MRGRARPTGTSSLRVWGRPPARRAVDLEAMAWNTTMLKRQKELAKRERQQKKARRREQRRAESDRRRQSASSGGDPDLAGIVPGPQPAPFF
jgi:hypothetical protein